jgi:nitrate reductase (cytochrome), electron transfer subunit
MEKKFLVVAVIALMIISACSSDKKTGEWIADENINMASAELLSDESPLGEMPVYVNTEEGESELYERAFENAPPMIPHKTKGLLPIKIDNNECLRCHMPNKSKHFEAIPVPETHFTDYRPEIILDGELYKVDAEANEVVAKNLGDKLSAAMFNCTLCHAPQAEITVDISNLFDPDFRRGKGSSSSNLSDVMDEGVK